MEATWPSRCVQAVSERLKDYFYEPKQQSRARES
jgi:hypothetical protein